MFLPRASPPIQFSRLNRRNSMSDRKREYVPSVKMVDDEIKYFVLFNEKSNGLIEVEVNKIIFLMFFGVHKLKIISNQKLYYIVFEDNLIKCELQLSKEEYRIFFSFKSEETRYKNIYDRYIEHSKQTDETMQKRVLVKPERVEDIVYKKILREEINKALESLNDTQRKRFVSYYLNDMTYEEIALEDDCSKQAVKYSIDIAKKHLREKLKKFNF